MNKNIGKKVYELVKVGNWSYVINKEKTYTIVGFKDYDEVDDYHPHYIIKDEDGNEKELLDYEVVFCPNDEYNGDEQIYHYLQDNGIYGEVYTNSEGEVEVEIDWGDWKHDHGWCATLMGYLGYVQDDVVVTEDNGSDCYSARHYYAKANA